MFLNTDSIASLDTELSEAMSRRKFDKKIIWN